MNVLVYSYRDDASGHAAYRAWLEALVDGDAPFAVADIVLSGFLRIVTHPRIFQLPAGMAEAVAFADALRGRPNAVPVAPAARHWAIFTRLCRESGTKGNLVPDAYLAALAIESGCELATADRGFARFAGLRWSHPLLP